MKIGIQLYTLRSVIEEDLLGNFKRLSKMGFQGVELAGFYQLSASELKSLLDQASLEVFSTHEGMKRLTNDIESVINDYKILGTKHIIIPHANLHDEQSYQEILPEIKKIVKRLTDEGFTVHYHNHSHEFVTFNGKTILDHLLEDIKELKLELDVYWARNANVDELKLIEKHQGRIHFIHAKDMKIEKGAPLFESVGSGIIDFKKIYQLTSEYWIVENDKPIGDPFVSIQKSIDYLKELKEGKL
jgi:sugar phosphate isomerase/epimerase